MFGESRKILLIGDNPLDTLCVRNILSDKEQFSAQLECTDCLASACDLLQADHGFDLIVLDLGLPDNTVVRPGCSRHHFNLHG
jgi:DNA-binding NarL/FixJ family response regulator